MVYVIREISRGYKGVGRNMVETMQAIVSFGEGQRPATRHLEKHNGGMWAGWNSDEVLHSRSGILDSFANHGQMAEAAKAKVQKLETEINELKGKRGIAESRKRLHEALKAAKAAESIAKSDLAMVKAIADQVDKTHPEIIEFV